MSDNPYEPPQSTDKAKPAPQPTPQFVKQVLWILFFQFCFLSVAALVLDGGHFFRISVITCIAMWIAFIVMSVMKKDNSSDQNSEP